MVLKREKMVRLRLSPEAYNYLENMETIYGECNGYSQAAEFYADYQTTRKGFFIRLIDKHFIEIKKLLRTIGRTR